MNHLELPSPLKSIINDIDRVIAARIYYPALAVCLTLPEICTSLEVDNSEFIKEKHYVAFLERYAPPEPGGLGIQPKQCYRLRGGVIHRGNASGHPFFGSTHVLFTLPEVNVSIHGISFQVEDTEQRASTFDLVTFCEGMKRAVYNWYAANQHNEKVAANVLNLLSYRPEGVRPFVVGCPVIASGP
jgi:hypothetical protein